MGFLWLLDLCGLVAWGGWFVHCHWPKEGVEEMDKRFARRHRYRT